jgi:hypothetical protein
VARPTQQIALQLTATAFVLNSSGQVVSVTVTPTTVPPGSQVASGLIIIRIQPSGPVTTQ